MKKIFRRLCISALLIVIAIIQPDVYAKSYDREKVIYIKFFKVIGAEKQYNEMVSILQNQYKQGVSASLQTHMAKIEDASPEKKEAYIQVINTSMERTNDRLIAEISEVMPFNELVENVYIPIYKKHFSTDEIDQITAFFESPVGNKFISISPQLMQESVTLLNQQYGEKIQQISMKTAQEEIALIKSELKELDKE